MAITALSGFEPEWFEPEGQGEGELTGFKLKPLTGPEYMDVLTHAQTIGFDVGLTATGMTLALNYGLVSWRNFNNSDGVAVPFNRPNRDFVSAPMLMKIADKILAISEMTAPQKKT